MQDKNNSIKEQVFESNLNKGLARYKASKVQPKGFNLFCSMFNWHNERYLHSSFIGMMLSMKREFLVSFLEELHRADEENKERNGIAGQGFKV